MMHPSLIKNNECMTYQFTKVLNNANYQYFIKVVKIVKVVNLSNCHLSKLLKCQVLIQIIFYDSQLLCVSLYVINNQPEIEIN